MEIKDAKPTIDLAIFKVNIAIVGSVFFISIFLLAKFLKEGIASWFTFSYSDLDIL